MGQADHPTHPCPECGAPASAQGVWLNGEPRIRFVEDAKTINPRVELRGRRGPGQTDVIIDGQKLKGVQHFRLEQHVSGYPMLVLTILAEMIDVDLEAEVIPKSV